MAKWIRNKNISEWTRKIHGFVNCVGLIDGTLFPLAFEPILKAKGYFTRKEDYAFKGLVICGNVASNICKVIGKLFKVNET